MLVLNVLTHAGLFGVAVALGLLALRRIAADRWSAVASPPLSKATESTGART